jgi:hypothetical protein
VCYELSRLRNWRVDLADLAALVAPLALVPILLALSPTASATAGDAGAIFPSGVLSLGPFHWWLSQKIIGLTVIFHVYDWSEDLAIGAALGALAAWGVASRRLTLHPAGRYLMMASVPIYFAIPTQLLGTWGADVRYPVAVLFFLIGLSRWRFSTNSARGATSGLLCTVFVVLCIAETAIVATDWHRFSGIQSEFRASFAAMPQGARVLVTRSRDLAGLGWTKTTRLFNIPCLAVIDRSALVSNIFAMTGHTVLGINSPYRDATAQIDDLPPLIEEVLTSAPGDRAYYRNWERDYDFVYVIPTRSGWRAPDDRLTLVYEGNKFQLYQVGRSSPL